MSKSLRILKVGQKRFDLKVNGYVCNIQGQLGMDQIEAKESLLVKENTFFFNSKRSQQTFTTKLNNAILGVTRGFGKELVIRGIGYKTWRVKKQMYFKLGYSHWLRFQIPSQMMIRGRKNRLIVFGSKKDEVGRVSLLLKSFREPDAYKGKGIHGIDEQLKLKVGKQRQR